MNTTVMEQAGGVATTQRPSKPDDRLRSLSWLAVILVGLVQDWFRRFNMNPDGVSYLDVADAYLKGDWHNAINAWWSPFYSWLAGAALFLIRPTAYWEITVIKAVNFLIYLFAWWATDFLVRALLARQASREEDYSSIIRAPVAANSLFAAALCLFLLTTTEWIPLAMVSPDLGVYAVLCVAAALLVRVHCGLGSTRDFALLGLVLGIGFLVKTIMFPIALVFLLLGWAVSWRRPAGLIRMLLASTVFVVVALPFVAALSMQKGRITIGDSGRVNYIWMQSRMSNDGDQSSMPTPDYRTRSRVHHPLDVLYFAEFATPVGGTDPMHYDPSYWAEGVKLKFSLAAQMRGLGKSMLSYQGICLQLAFLIVVLFALLLLNWRALEMRRAILRQWPLFVVALTGLALYALVLVEERYVAGFIALALLTLFASTRLPVGAFSMKLDLAASLAMVAVFGFAYGPRYAYETIHTAIDFVRHSDCPKHGHTQWRVAQALGQLGIARGDRIGTLFVASDAYYARLAGIKIVAQLGVNGKDPDFSTIRKLVPECFNTEGGLSKDALAAFSAAGAKAVIARDVPQPEKNRGWIQLAGTEYYALALTK